MSKVCNRSIEECNLTQVHSWSHGANARCGTQSGEMMSPGYSVRMLIWLRRTRRPPLNSLGYRDPILPVSEPRGIGALHWYSLASSRPSAVDSPGMYRQSDNDRRAKTLFQLGGGGQDQNRVSSCNTMRWFSPHPLKSFWFLMQYKGKEPKCKWYKYLLRHNAKIM